MPPLHRIQLLRSLPQQRQETGDAQIGPACLVLFAVRALLMVSVTCPACWVCRAIACISNGRLVIASSR
jgi:hypothetical protein